MPKSGTENSTGTEAVPQDQMDPKSREYLFAGRSVRREATPSITERRLWGSTTHLRHLRQDYRQYMHLGRVRHPF